MKLEDIEIGKRYVVDETYRKNKTFVEAIQKPFKDKDHVRVRWLSGKKEDWINVKHILREATEEDNCVLVFELLDG